MEEITMKKVSSESLFLSSQSQYYDSGYAFQLDSTILWNLKDWNICNIACN